MVDNSGRGVIVSQYVLYFGVLGIFLPYFTLYCHHLDFSSIQIGVIAAIRTITTALFPLLWGVLADRFRIRKPIYVACSLISAAVWALYLLTVNFWAMLAITLCYGVFYAPIISFLEAFTMDHLGENKRRYGHVRAWGSVSFIVIVMLVGRLIDATSVRIILPLVLIGAGLQALMSIRVPAGGAVAAASGVAPIGHLRKRPVPLFLGAAFLMLVSHGTYYGFFSIHLEAIGFGGTFIGSTWALASGAEILVMINSPRLFNRFSMRHVLIASFLIATVRWLLLAHTESAPLILLAQVLHAATYGAFHMASILYIDALMPAESKTLGQAANNAVTYGLGMMTGFLINGLLYDVIGARALFTISGATALGGAMLLVFGLKGTVDGR